MCCNNMKMKEEYTTEDDGRGDAVVNLFGDSLLTQRYSATCFDRLQGKPFLTGHHTDHSPSLLEASNVCLHCQVKLILETTLGYIVLLFCKSNDSV